MARGATNFTFHACVHIEWNVQANLIVYTLYKLIAYEKDGMNFPMEQMALRTSKHIVSLRLCFLGVNKWMLHIFLNNCLEFFISIMEKKELLKNLRNHF